ncbi:MAG TPA: hypothetical protein VGR85_09010 [Candidatus Limnocylindria bacterium]|nr:hypothetical protein [Candidatus Limnocylindria bacterium]
MRLNWRGDEVLQRVRAATVQGMDDFAATAAETAMHDHPGWQNRTGQAQRSLRAVPARIVAGGVKGAVGFGIARGFFLEFTTRGHPGDRTVNRAVERLGRSLVRRIASNLS